MLTGKESEKVFAGAFVTGWHAVLPQSDQDKIETEMEGDGLIKSPTFQSNRLVPDVLPVGLHYG